MDQVKVFLRLLKKHHFWLLVSLAAPVGFICWWSGAWRVLATATQANEGIVKKSYGDLERVDKNGHPANQNFADGVNAKNEELKTKVLEEWKESYEASTARHSVGRR